MNFSIGEIFDHHLGFNHWVYKVEVTLAAFPHHSSADLSLAIVVIAVKLTSF